MVSCSGSFTCGKCRQSICYCQGSRSCVGVLPCVEGVELCDSCGDTCPECENKRKAVVSE